MRIAPLAGLLLIVGASACRQPNPDWMGPNDSSQDVSTSADDATTAEPPTTTGQDASGSGSSTGPGCPNPTDMVCGGQCTDVLTDRKHCGECGNMCTGNVDCVDGVCQ